MSGEPAKPGKAAESNPGDGLRSLRSSMLFRATNFELYAKPNKVIMALGLLGLSISVGYIVFMRAKYESMGFYTAVNEEGEQVLRQKASRWA